MNVTWMLLLLAGQIGPASDAPALRCTLNDRSLVVAGLPPLLDDPEVARHLGSGLTATLELAVDARASGARAPSIRRGPLPARMNALYVSYDGALDPLGRSQVVPYLEGLAARGWRFDLVTFEKERRWHDGRERSEMQRRLAAARIASLGGGALSSSRPIADGASGCGGLGSEGASVLAHSGIGGGPSARRDALAVRARPATSPV